MLKIASDVSAADAAVTGVNSVLVENGVHFALGRSNVSGMKDGTDTNSRILPALSKLTDSVKMWADKSPQLAQAMEERDRNTTFDFGGDNDVK